MKRNFKIQGLMMLFTAISMFGFRLPEQALSTLKLHITGLKNSNGMVVCYLFNKQDGFPNSRDKAAQVVSGTIANGSTTIAFAKVPAGQYAILCFHDENGDQKLNTNMFGKPIEGVVFSNNARGGITGPPSFDKAKIEIKSQSEAIEMKMIYL